MLPRTSWRNPRASPSTRFQIAMFSDDCVRDELLGCPLPPSFLTARSQFSAACFSGWTIQSTRLSLREVASRRDGMGVANGCTPWRSPAGQADVPGGVTPRGALSSARAMASRRSSRSVLQWRPGVGRKAKLTVRRASQGEAKRFTETIVEASDGSGDLVLVSLVELDA